MKRRTSLLPQKKVVLWPEAKVYVTRGYVRQTQRVPLYKVAVAATVGKAVIYFESDPVVLN